MADEKILRVEANIREEVHQDVRPSAGQSIRDDSARRSAALEDEYSSVPGAGLAGEASAAQRIEDREDTELPEKFRQVAGEAIEVQQAAAATRAAAAAGAATGEAAASAGSAGGAAAAGASLAVVGLVAAEVAFGLVALAAAAVSAAVALSHIQDNLLSRFEDVSPGIALARAEQEQALFEKRLELEGQVSGEGQLFIDTQTEIKMVILEIKAELIEIIAPLLQHLLAFLKLVLDVIEEMLEFANWLQEQVVTFMQTVSSWAESLPLIGSLAKQCSQYLQGILGALKEEDQPDPFQQEAVDFLTGKSGDSLGQRGFRDAMGRRSSKPPKRRKP